MLICILCLINVLNILLKRVMIQRYYSILHVCWSTPLQWAITLPYSIVRWQDVHSTLWWHILKFGHGRKMSDNRIMPFAVVPWMASLQLLWLRTSYWAHLWLTAPGIRLPIIFLCFTYVLLLVLPSLMLWRSRPGVNFYLHCSRLLGW